MRNTGSHRGTARSRENAPRSRTGRPYRGPASGHRLRHRHRRQQPDRPGQQRQARRTPPPGRPRQVTAPAPTRGAKEGRQIAKRNYIVMSSRAMRACLPADRPFMSLRTGRSARFPRDCPIFGLLGAARRPSSQVRGHLSTTTDGQFHRSPDTPDVGGDACACGGFPAVPGPVAGEVEPVVVEGGGGAKPSPRTSRGSAPEGTSPGTSVRALSSWLFRSGGPQALTWLISRHYPGASLTAHLHAMNALAVAVEVVGIMPAR
jgi:hypothetical protein